MFKKFIKKKLGAAPNLLKEEEAQPEDKPENEPIILLKDDKGRIYDKRAKLYVTNKDLCGMILAHENFRIHDIDTGEDLTQEVLTGLAVEVSF